MGSIVKSLFYYNSVVNVRTLSSVLGSFNGTLGCPEMRLELLYSPNEGLISVYITNITDISVY